MATTITYQRLSALAQAADIFGARCQFTAADEAHEQWRELASTMTEADWTAYHEWAKS